MRLGVPVIVILPILLWATWGPMILSLIWDLTPLPIQVIRYLIELRHIENNILQDVVYEFLHCGLDRIVIVAWQCMPAALRMDGDSGLFDIGRY